MAVSAPYAIGIDGQIWWLTAANNRQVATHLVCEHPLEGGKAQRRKRDGFAEVSGTRL